MTSLLTGRQVPARPVHEHLLPISSSTGRAAGTYCRRAVTAELSKDGLDHWKLSDLRTGSVKPPPTTQRG